MIYCRECKFFLNEGIDGYGYCKLSNKERRCSQLCEGLEYERKIERKQQMNTLIEDFTSDGNIENKINDILGRQQPDGTSQCRTQAVTQP